MEQSKAAVQEFWNQAACGEELYLKGDTEMQAYANQSEKRYLLEPYINNFADFENSTDKIVLEIGVGLGADHQRFAEAGAILYGIDLTERAITNTKKRLQLLGLASQLAEGDAEHLAFSDNFFDIVYSWGVIHHSPATPNAIYEIYRVLKPGGEARIMIYHTNSFVGYMLWLRYALLKARPFTSLKTIYANYLESPGTKAYTIKEANKLFEAFSSVSIETKLTHADLLSSAAGQRHKSALLSIARKLYPRWLIKLFFPRHGLFMLIKATK